MTDIIERVFVNGIDPVEREHLLRVCTGPVPVLGA